MPKFHQSPSDQRTTSHVFISQISNSDSDEVVYSLLYRVYLLDLTINLLRCVELLAGVAIHKEIIHNSTYTVDHTQLISQTIRTKQAVW
jgi:hypothetical protein